MSISKSEIITFVKDLSRRDDLDEDTLAIYYDDVMEEIAANINAPLVEVELFDIISGTSTYAYENNVIKLLDIFIDDKTMSVAEISDLEAYDKDWESLTGTPWGYTEGEVTARNFKLIPIPDANSDALIPIHGEPFGEDYPDGIGVQLFVAKRDNDIPDWLTLFIVLKMISKEFSRPSEYQDMLFSETCEQASAFIWGAIGL